MGFVRGNIIPILKEHKRAPFKGHCLCLGQADVYFTHSNLTNMAKLAKVNLIDNVTVTLSHRPDLAIKGYISRETLFESIGFNRVSALDYSEYESAEYIYDLNNEELPNSLLEQFDTVIDHGTMEHVFHVPNCLRNIHAMLKIGGRVIHSSPSSNFMDHGFYMFSPTFFNDYYNTNNWEIHSIQVATSIPERQEYESSFYTDYEPGLFDHLSYGGLDGRAYGTILIAEKLNKSTSNIVPQQGFYRNIEQWIKTENDNKPSIEITLSQQFTLESGNCWTIRLTEYNVSLGDDMVAPKRSRLVLLENGKAIGKPHSGHDLIRLYGMGCYSHWLDTLYFSTSDNSNPNTNGRLYQISITSN